MLHDLNGAHRKGSAVCANSAEGGIMGTTLVHVSDIHFRSGWEENHGVVLGSFLEDVEKQKAKRGNDDVYLVLSGDVVQQGDRSESYDEFLTLFGGGLDKLGIPRSHRVCVPGNHDVSQLRVEQSLVDHEGVVSQMLDETDFNDYWEKKPLSVFSEKFGHYTAFENQFSAFPVCGASLVGAGFDLNSDVAIYCLNSALLSSGGLRGTNAEAISDKQRLAVETRRLNSWIQQTQGPCRVLVMHHPLDWLQVAMARELKALIHHHFALVLSGHAHDQSTYHSLDPSGSLVWISAPPLFTNKSDLIGYGLITLISEQPCIAEIAYRQWTQHRVFVSGVSFSGTEDGVIRIAARLAVGTQDSESSPDVVDQYLTRELREALTAFSAQPDVWVEPIISDKPESDPLAAEGRRFSPSQLVESPVSTVIQAPGQFGLSCLCRHLAQEA